MELNATFYKSYYDLGFDKEKQIVDEIIASGETSALRCMRRLERECNAHIRDFEQEGDGFRFTFEKRPPTEISASTLPTGKQPFFDTALRDQSWLLPSYLPTKSQVPGFISDYLSRNPQITTVVELGAGTGRNLVDIFYDGCAPNIRLVAAEPSQNGRDIIQKVTDLDDRLNIEAVPFDFCAPDLSFISPQENVLYFTCFSVMFVREIGEAPLLAIADSADNVTCAHFEPVGFQVTNRSNPISDVQAREAEMKGWNLDLAARLVSLYNAEKIDLKFVSPHIFAHPNASHTFSLLLWSKK